MRNPNSPWRKPQFSMQFAKLKEARREEKLRKQREQYHADAADPIYREAMREQRRTNRKAGV